MIPDPTFRSHAGESRHAHIDIIVDDHLTFGIVETVQPARILGKCAPSCNWHGKEQGIKTRIVETLTKIASGRDDDVVPQFGESRQAEVGAGKTMVERTEQRFNIKPKWLAADTAYGSGPNLNWLVKDKDIAPHIPVIDKSKREDGTFSREDFRFDKERMSGISACETDLTA